MFEIYIKNQVKGQNIFFEEHNQNIFFKMTLNIHLIVNAFFKYACIV